MRARSTPPLAPAPEQRPPNCRESSIRSSPAAMSRGWSPTRRDCRRRRSPAAECSPASQVQVGQQGGGRGAAVDDRGREVAAGGSRGPPPLFLAALQSQRVPDRPSADPATRRSSPEPRPSAHGFFGRPGRLQVDRPGKLCCDRRRRAQGDDRPTLARQPLPPPRAARRWEINAP